MQSNNVILLLQPREARKRAAGKDKLSTSAPKRNHEESSAKQKVTRKIEKQELNKGFYPTWVESTILHFFPFFLPTWIQPRRCCGEIGRAHV